MKFTCGGAIVLDRERGNEMDCLQLLMIVGGHTFTNKELNTQRTDKRRVRE